MIKIHVCWMGFCWCLRCVRRCVCVCVFARACWHICPLREHRAKHTKSDTFILLFDSKTERFFPLLAQPNINVIYIVCIDGRCFFLGPIFFSLFLMLFTHTASNELRSHSLKFICFELFCAVECVRNV